MSRFPPDRSEILSLLLDEVTGTQEAINIRQDFCRLLDTIYSTIQPIRMYYTGSKAEGLDLPGSDDDLMFDVNDLLNVKIVQSVREISATPSYEEFLLCTENVKPGFVLLRRIRQHADTVNQRLKAALETISNVEYLSSDKLVGNFFHDWGPIHIGPTQVRQGPSVEQRVPHQDPSEPGIDMVKSIRCFFWPDDASEWIQRSRLFGWPRSDVISSIVDFGCHVVAVGHPKSETKLTEWRLSFSIAERALVWSFNHVQLQCYAVLKIILKQFIKLKCSPQNQVLCSYFIKTFLFWKYETTHLNFWCKSNFWECIIYLLKEFAKCIRKGEIRHYFLPKFNLLSVKLTPGAQAELLHLLHNIIHYDISIFNECTAMQTVWSSFLLANENQMKIINNARKTHLLLNDELMKEKFSGLIELFSCDFPYFYKSILNHTLMKMPLENVKSWFPQIDDQILSFALQFARNIPDLFDRFIKRPPTTYELRNHILKVSCQSFLKFLLLRYLCLKMPIESSIHLHDRNKTFYMLQQINRTNASFDVSSGKLWYAIMVLKSQSARKPCKIVHMLLFQTELIFGP